jgi:2-C-methyl-D-erythritol 4-phosphate cytidylyltransferase
VSPLITNVVVLARHNRTTEAQALITNYRYSELARVILSEQGWRASLAVGLAALPESCEWVIVHDAARPLVQDRYFAWGLQVALGAEGVALACEPVTDTLKRVADGRVVETLPRANLRRLETPMVIRRDLLARALQSASESAGLAEIAQACGVRIALYDVNYINPSVTNETDWFAVETELKNSVFYLDELLDNNHT